MSMEVDKGAELQKALKMEAFNVACRTIFDGTYDDDDSKEVMDWMALTDGTPLPDGLKAGAVYEPYFAPQKLKQVIISTTQSLYTIMTQGASMVVEFAEAEDLTVEELVDIMGTI